MFTRVTEKGISEEMPFFNWGERWGSNPRQPVPQTGALPTELRSPLTATKFFYRQSRIKSSQIFSKNIFILMPKLTIYFLFWPNHTLIG